VPAQRMLSSVARASAVSKTIHPFVLQNTTNPEAVQPPE
jgi:hypothetical protein